MTVSVSVPSSRTSTAYTRSSPTRRVADDRGLADAPGLVEHSLDVLRKDIEPFRCDDHLLLASAHEQTACVVQLADVTGMEPAVGERLRRRRVLPVVTLCHVVAAHEDLAIRSDLEFHAGDRRPDGACTRLERMVERDDGCGLGQTVSLHDEEAEPRPEPLELRIERRRPDDEAPELEAEQSVDASIPPPAPQPVFGCGR